ncbi:pentapeptide repeat-containing protein [Streptomyces mirabilis]|uniref:pentapeptide repeat-containing protein n=1 Tax=Streptomyces mirabilis TaxID=68239 RepID=UPI0036E77749
MSTPLAVPAAPSWPYCAHGADPAADPVGCRGIHVPGHTTCLAHLADTDRDAYLAIITPGANIDHRGTPFTGNLLDRLLDALRDPATLNVRLGAGTFDGAEFSDRAVFSGAQFSGHARFDRARFARSARFDGAQFSLSAAFRGAEFSGAAVFDGAQFSSWTGFGRAQFSGPADFDGARFTGAAKFEDTEFSGDAEFGGVRFSGDAEFEGARFSGKAGFGGAQFSGKAGFGMARFATASLLGPLVCKNVVELWGAVFKAPVTLEIAARDVWCARTQWESTARVRLRYATVDLRQAALSAPVAITAHPRPFDTSSTSAVDENLLSGFREGVRVASVQGVDAAHLVLTDTDLTDCLFSGAFHLDQLRLEGHTIFASVPTGFHRRGIRLTRWTRRRTLAEEHHWRAQTAGQPDPLPGHAPSPRLWRPGPHHPDPNLTPDPVDIAALYRQLRKAFEDGKNEPGAADFYYGECEMRRHDGTDTPKGERHLLWWYWLLFVGDLHAGPFPGCVTGDQRRPSHRPEPRCQRRGCSRRSGYAARAAGQANSQTHTQHSTRELPISNLY